MAKCNYVILYQFFRKATITITNTLDNSEKKFNLTGGGYVDNLGRKLPNIYYKFYGEVDIEIKENTIYTLVGYVGLIDSGNGEGYHLYETIIFDTPPKKEGLDGKYTYIWETEGISYTTELENEM